MLDRMDSSVSLTFATLATVRTQTLIRLACHTWHFDYYCCVAINQNTNFSQSLEMLIKIGRQPKARPIYVFVNDSDDGGDDDDNDHGIRLRHLCNVSAIMLWLLLLVHVVRF